MDDEPALHEICRRVLEHADFLVDEAANGQEALNLCRQAQNEGRPFAMAMLDLAMPVMDGRECLLSLRANHPGIKVLVGRATARAGSAPRRSEPTP